MNQAQVQIATAGSVRYDAALPVQPDANWFDADWWASRQCIERHVGGRGGVAFIDTPVGVCALRHYHRGGLVARLSADRYLWSGAQRTRAFREFDLLAHLVGAGLPVAAPVAAQYQRDGLHYRADLITRRIPDAQTLAERLHAGSLDAGIAARVGATISRFHAAGAWHADLNAHNILVDMQQQIWLIDFDRGRIREPQAVWQQANLDRLHRSFDKLEAPRHLPGFDAAFWRPLVTAWRSGLVGAPTQDSP